MIAKMSKQPPPALTASAVGPCPTVIQIVGRPYTGSLPSTIAPPDLPRLMTELVVNVQSTLVVSNRRDPLKPLGPGVQSSNEKTCGACCRFPLPGTEPEWNSSSVRRIFTI